MTSIEAAKHIANLNISMQQSSSGHKTLLSSLDQEHRDMTRACLVVYINHSDFELWLGVPLILMEESGSLKH